MSSRGRGDDVIGYKLEGIYVPSSTSDQERVASGVMKKGKMDSCPSFLSLVEHRPNLGSLAYLLSPQCLFEPE